MAVKVVVKGDKGGDYELIAFDGRKNRIYDHEVLEMFDDNNNILYSVPLSRIRYLQIINDESLQLPQYAGDNRNIVVTIEGGESGDLTIQCDRISLDRFINDIVIDLHTYMGMDPQTKEDMWFREFSVPFVNIKFINYNNIPEELIGNTPEIVSNPSVEKKPSYRRNLQK